MKKFMVLMLIFIMSISLFACSSSSDSGSGSNSSSSNPTENAASNNEKQEQIDISFAEHVADIEKQSPHVVKIVEKFMAQNPNIKIDLSGSEVSEHLTKMKLAAQNDNLPDIFFLEQNVAKEMAAAGYLYDLTEEVQSRGINDHLLEMMRNAAAVDGKTYGIPVEVIMCGLFYNKAIFEKYDVKVPETFEELLAAVDTFHKNNVIPISNGAKSSYSVWTFQGMLTRYGFFEKLDGLNSGEISYVNEDFIKFYEKVKTLKEHNAFSENVVNMDYFQAIEQFLGGKAAMVDSGAWEIAKFEKSDIAKDIGFVFGPTFSDGVGEQKKGIKTAGGVYSVSAKAAKDPQKLEAIMKFFQFYYGPEGTDIIVKESSGLPTTKFDGEVNKEEHPILAEMIAQLNNSEWQSVDQPYNQMSQNMGNTLFDSIWGVINGVYSPEEAAQTMEDAMALERGKK